MTFKRLLSILIIINMHYGSNCSAIPQLSEMENKIIDAPDILCDIRHIRVRFMTAQTFFGNIYAKGFFHKSECRSRGNHTNGHLDFIIPLDSECGIRRKRIINPRGIIVDVNVILMFHPIFLTQNDRSYHVQCQYSLSDRTVTNVLDVSMPPDLELPQQSPPESMEVPVCKYEVLKGDQEGETLTQATVGEKVYHRWSCTGNSDNFCMTVHSCIVDDGHGFGQKIIDENGCSLDSFILPNLNYSNGLTAGQSANVFKFADKPTVFFSCTIKLEMRESSKSTCFDPQMMCSNKTGLQEISTNRKFDNDIPDGFPKPPSTVYGGDDQMKNDMTKFDPKIISRIIRRDLRKQFTADVDVSAQAFDVLDISYSGNNKKESKTIVIKDERIAINDVCISKTFLTIIVIGALFLLIPVIICTVYLMRNHGKTNNMQSKTSTLSGSYF